MRARVTDDARADLYNIKDYITTHDALAAERVLTRIGIVIGRLKLLPRVGHAGIVQGTYEISVPRLPFLIVYRVDITDSGEELVVLRVYTTIIPLLIDAIKGIAGITGAFKANLIAWLADAQNGVVDLFAKNLHAENGTFDTLKTRQLCVDDICITRDQFMSVFGASAHSQSAAAGASGLVSGVEAPDGSSTPVGADADTATTTTPAAIDPDASNAPAANNPEVHQADNGAGNPPTAETPAAEPLTTQLVEAPPEPAPEATSDPTAVPGPANDNTPPEALPATGTE